MAKEAKKTQTDYTTAGHDISQTAVPLYQNALTQYSDLSSNYQDNLDKIIKKYYSNTSSQSDFLRNYQRAMSNTTANNYSATGGGYSSSGQRAYNDQQRYQNDLASRLQQQGLTGAQGILGNQLSAINTGLGQYNTAYGLGKEYSDIEQYNYLADQANSWTNQLGSALGTVGTVVGGAIGGPAGATLGGAIGSGIGGTMSTDTSGAFASIGASGSGTSSNPWTNLGNTAQTYYQNRADSGQGTVWNSLFNGNKKAPIPNS